MLDLFTFEWEGANSREEFSWMCKYKTEEREREIVKLELSLANGGHKGNSRQCTAIGVSVGSSFISHFISNIKVNQDR